MASLRECDKEFFISWVAKNGEVHRQDIFPINLESHVIAEAVGNVERGYLRNGWVPSVIHFHKHQEACDGNFHRYFIEENE
jgi:hypothetical protein